MGKDDFMFEWLSGDGCVKWLNKAELFAYVLRDSRKHVDFCLKAVKERTEKLMEEINEEDIRWAFTSIPFELMNNGGRESVYKKLFFELQSAIKGGKSIEEKTEERVQQIADTTFDCEIENHARSTLKHLARKVSRFSVLTPYEFLRTKYAPGKFDKFNYNVVSTDDYEERLASVANEIVFENRSAGWLHFDPSVKIIKKAPMAYISDQEAEKLISSLFRLSGRTSKYVNFDVHGYSAEEKSEKKDKSAERSDA